LRIHTPFGSPVDSLLQRINYRFLRPFSLCWVPDSEGEDSLAGKLSHPDRMPVTPLRYIGWLSRFDGSGKDGSWGEGLGDLDDLLVLLSGPEPQRTLLEETLLAQVGTWKGRMILVRGLPAGGRPLKVPEGILVYDHLPAKELEGVIRSAGLVLTRSGYSTVMDLARLGKKAILIPTPGQTEQEYLGDYLARRGWALCIQQTAFSLPAALAAAQAFPFRKAEERDGDRLKKEIGALLNPLPLT
jgi:UDP-N-acetylglucosamine transferase subunit ALG13